MKKKSIQSESTRLRKFGGILALIFGLLSISHKTWIPVPVLLLLVLLVRPLWLKPIEKNFIKLGEAMGFVMTRVILFFFYFLVITPISCLLKLGSKSLMPLGFEREKASYWIDSPVSQTSRDEKQF
jgi:hypothetical protein